MKQKIKKICIPVFLAILCGALSGKLVYSIYANETELTLTSNKIYLLEAGSYENYDSMRSNTIGINYVYYEEDDKFKTIIAIVKDKDNIDKIKAIYDGEIVVNEYYLNDENLNEKLTQLDNKLKSLEESDEIKQVIIEMLDLYKGDNDIKLVKIS